MAALAVMTFGIYSVVTPIWEAPDEVGHMAYVAHLARTRTLPLQRPHDMGEHHQPPLYYVLAALPVALVADLTDPTGNFRFNPGIVWGNRGGDDVNAAVHSSAENRPYRGMALAVHIARAVSVVCATVAVAAIVSIARVTFPSAPLVALLTGLLVVGNPQFAFIAGSVNNDNLLNAIAASLLLVVARAVTLGVSASHWFAAALLTAVGILTKLSIVPIALVATATLTIITITAHGLFSWFRWSVASAALILLGTGWWFWRNAMVYGDLVGWSVFAQSFSALLGDGAFPWTRYPEMLNTQFRSYWGVFGWMTLPAPAWFHVTVGLLCLMSLVGLIAWLTGRTYLPRPVSAWRVAAVLASAVVAHEVYLAIAVRTFGASWYQGRYLFPAGGPAAVLMGAGLLALVPPSLWSMTVASLAAAFIAGTCWMAFAVIVPAYT